MKTMRYIAVGLVATLFSLTACDKYEMGKEFLSLKPVYEETTSGGTATSDESGNNDESGNSSETTITTGTENGHVWVDLGLSVKWATMNVGASSPEDYGSYFAWGETTTKSIYEWENYKYGNGSVETLNKYNTRYSNGTVDRKTTLDLSDDAARQNWGGAWRMPTYDELEELRTQCSWTWITQNGVNGYKVTSKTNGSSIFLPAAGGRYDDVFDTGTDGYYWSSSLYTNDCYAAYLLKFYSYNVKWDDSNFYRQGGRSVRPVCP